MVAPSELLEPHGPNEEPYLHHLFPLTQKSRIFRWDVSLSVTPTNQTGLSTRFCFRQSVSNRDNQQSSIQPIWRACRMTRFVQLRSRPFYLRRLNKQFSWLRPHRRCAWHILLFWVGRRHHLNQKWSTHRISLWCKLVVEMIAHSCKAVPNVWCDDAAQSQLLCKKVFSHDPRKK